MQLSLEAASEALRQALEQGDGRPCRPCCTSA
jgi:hypothetical protein